MYKDKPYSYASSRRQTPLYQRKRVIATVFTTLLALVYWLGFFSPHLQTGSKAPSGPISSLLGKSGSSINWDSRRDAVRDAFVLSWDGYQKYAWGM